MRRLIPLSLLLACSPPSGPIDSGNPDKPAPTLTSLTPTHGPQGGGTSVTVKGSNFVQGATVVFGSTGAASVMVTSSTQLVAVTASAPAPGVASVTVVNPDGKQASLPDAFVFDGDGQIAEAVIVNPASAMDSSGASALVVAVTAQVKIPGLTEAVGQGSGVRAQVGFALDNQPPANWVDAAFSKDADLFDEYAGAVTLTTPMGMGVTTYVLGARFSVDNGVTWTLADRDGSANGFSEVELPRITVSQPAVDWCKLGGVVTTAPDTFSLHVGDTGPTIYAQVYKQNLTEGAGAGAGIVGELGVGLATADPATWSFVPGTFNANQQNNDEWKAVLPTTAAPGAYKFAFRFNVNGGAWTYCDSDSATNGFTIDQCGSLSLKNAGIDECRLQFPLTLSSVQGVDAGNVYGWVYSQGVTEAAGAGPGIEGQLGFGASGTMPTDSTWSWTPAGYHVEEANGQEEWQAPLVGPAPGAYAYAYRFRLDGGTWTYCDSDPSDGVLSLAQLGALTARAYGPQIASCRLATVDNFAIGSGDALSVTARVRIPGFSEDAGVTAGLRGQVGVGTKDDNASTSNTWGWGEAAFSKDAFDGGEDEFAATVHPAYSGTRAVSFRFSVDDGGSWTYCDLNGSDVNGYEVNEQWNVTVGPGPSNINFCNLQFPPTMTIAANDGGDVYGQIYLAGVQTRPFPGVTAQAGWGVKVEDPGVAASWTWIDAGYNVSGSGGNNDEYVARIRPPVGTWSYAYRFSQNGGATYCYGDLDGNGTTAINGTDPGSFNGEAGANENLGVATVTP